MVRNELFSWNNHEQIISANIRYLLLNLAYKPIPSHEVEEIENNYCYGLIHVWWSYKATDRDISSFYIYKQ